MPNIAFRVSNTPIYRTILIAQAIIESDSEYKIFFLCSDAANKNIVDQSGFHFVSLPPITSNYEDLEETSTLLSTLAIDILIIDNPQVDSKYLKSISDKAKFLVLIDDLCKLSKYQADLIINPNVYSIDFDYNTPQETKILLGSEFFVLPKVFDDFSDYTRENPSVAKKILVYLGSKDKDGVTINVVTALKQIKENFSATLVLDRSFDKGQKLAEVIGLDDRFVIINENDEIKKKISFCDLGIIGSCDLFYEFAFFRIPCISLLVNDNQKTLSSALASYSFTYASTTSIDSLTRTISTLMNDKIARDRLSNRLEELIDGLGRFRVAEEIISAYKGKYKSS